MAKGIIYEQNRQANAQVVNTVETEKLSSMADVEQEELFTCKGVFPFDFFPNVVTVFRNKVSIVKKTFFIMKEMTNVPIKNINYVTAHAGFPFASLEISDRYFTEQPIIITHLKRSDAETAMKIIDGLRLAVDQKIDVTQVPKNDLLNDVLKIGVIA